MLTVRLEKLGLEPGCKMLDVGCGTGRHIRHARLLPGVIAVGLDLGWKEVRDTADNLRETQSIPAKWGGPNPEAGPWMVVRGSAFDLPFAQDAFDCVIISEVLEHLTDDAAALRELSRVLKPGGVLAVSVPRQGPEALCWALSESYRNTTGGHVRVYNRTALRKKLVDHGYRIFDSHFAHGLHSPFWWLKCIAGVNEEERGLVALYRRLLDWDVMKKPLLTRVLDRALDPVIGKSVVFYGIKQW